MKLRETVKSGDQNSLSEEVKKQGVKKIYKKHIPSEWIFDNYIIPSNDSVSEKLYNTSACEIWECLPEYITSMNYKTFIKLSSFYFCESFYFENYKIVETAGQSILSAKNGSKNVIISHRDSGLLYRINEHSYIFKKIRRFNDGNRIDYFLIITDSYSTFGDGDLRNNIYKTINKLIEDYTNFYNEHEKKRDFDFSIFDRIFLPADFKNDILGDIQDFINSKNQYEDLGLPWKRGYIFSGEPGNGKTLMLRLLREGFGLFTSNLLDYINPQTGRLELEVSTENFDNYSDINDLDLYNLSKPFWFKETPKIYYIEDLDKIVGRTDVDYAQITLSNLLTAIDGMEQLDDGFLLIATTNYIKDLAEAIVGRPGRFDRVFEFENPKIEEIKLFFDYHKIKFNTQSSFDKVVNDLSGYSMAFVEEFLKSMKMKYKKNEFTYNESHEILERIHKHNEIKKKIIDKIGF